VLVLAAKGLNQSDIARTTGIPRSTIRDWLSRGGRTTPPDPRATIPPGPYAYLLGLYLGDGYIARGARTSCLRIYFDARYPAIIGECVRVLRQARPANRVWVGRRRPSRCVVVLCHSTQ